MEKLTSDNLTEFIDTYPTKYQYGFLGSETNEVLKHDMKSDILVLINRKNQLSDRLHID